MPRTTICLGYLALLVALIAVPLVVPKTDAIIRHLWGQADYKFLTLGTGFANPPAEFFLLKSTGWKVEDFDIDSCGNAYIVLRKDP